MSRKPVKMLKVFIEDCYDAITILSDDAAGKLLKIMAADAMEIDHGYIDDSLLPVWMMIRKGMRRASDYSQKQREDSMSRRIPANPGLSHSPSPSPSPSLSKSKKNTNTVCVDPDFETFWKAYPKKNGRKDTLRAWKKTANDRPPLPELLDIVEFWKTREIWTKDAGQYVKAPAAWLNGHRWDDDQTNVAEDGNIRAQRIMDKIRGKII